MRVGRLYNAGVKVTTLEDPFSPFRDLTHSHGVLRWTGAELAVPLVPQVNSPPKLWKIITTASASASALPARNKSASTSPTSQKPNRPPTKQKPPNPRDLHSLTPTSCHGQNGQKCPPPQFHGRTASTAVESPAGKHGHSIKTKRGRANRQHATRPALWAY